VFEIAIGFHLIMIDKKREIIDSKRIMQNSEGMRQLDSLLTCQSSELRSAKPNQVVPSLLSSR